MSSLTECEVDMITNRVCERGTQNCDQNHLEDALADEPMIVGEADAQPHD